MGKGKAPSKAPSKADKTSSTRSQNQSKRNKIGKAESKNFHQRDKKKSDNQEDSKRIHYVLAPEKIKEKMMEVKDAERREKQKSFQTEKRKRNAAFKKTTSKGQPVLNARMKVLYSQIEKSYGSGKA